MPDWWEQAKIQSTHILKDPRVSPVLKEYVENFKLDEVSTLYNLWGAFMKEVLEKAATASASSALLYSTFQIPVQIRLSPRLKEPLENLAGLVLLGSYP
jgi:hypothetical protein